MRNNEQHITSEIVHKKRSDGDLFGDDVWQGKVDPIFFVESIRLKIVNHSQKNNILDVNRNGQITFDGAAVHQTCSSSHDMT